MELLVLGLGLAGHQGLQRGEKLDEARQQGLLREFLEALVEEEAVAEIAGGLGVGGG